MSTIAATQIDRKFLDKQVGDWKKLADRYKNYFTWNNKAAALVVGISLGICFIIGLILAAIIPTNKLLVILISLGFGVVTALMIIMVLAMNAMKKPMVVVGQVKQLTRIKRNNVDAGLYLKFNVLKAAFVTVNGIDQENDELIGKDINISGGSIKYFEKCPSDQIHTIFITGTNSLLTLLEDGQDLVETGVAVK